MMPLSQLQERFVYSLLQESIDPAFSSHFGSLDNPHIVSLDTASLNIDSFSIHQRFGIYRHNYQETLFKTLKHAYPVCCSLLGEACFRALAFRFIQKQTSRHFSLNAFGENFSNFSESYAREWSLPYLPDVARLEWIIHLTIHGPKNSNFSFEELLSIPEQQQSELVFSLAENGRLFFSPFPIDKIWAAHQANHAWQEPVPRIWQEPVPRIQANHAWQESIPSIPTSIPTIDLAEGETRIFIYRDDEMDYAIHLAPLTTLEWQLLTGIEAGLTIGDLYENFTKKEEQEAVGTLASCVQKGYITGMYVKT